MRLEKKKKIQALSAQLIVNLWKNLDIKEITSLYRTYFASEIAPPLFYSKEVPPKLIYYKGTKKDHVATFIFLLSFHDANSIKTGIAMPNKVI